MNEDENGETDPDELTIALTPKQLACVAAFIALLVIVSRARRRASRARTD